MPMSDAETAAMVKERENESWAEFMSDPERRTTMDEYAKTNPQVAEALKVAFRTGWSFGFSSGLKLCGGIKGSGT